MAAVYNFPEVINYICQVEPLHMELLDGKKATALMCAMKRGSVEAAEALLANGAKVSTMDKNNRTALHHAAFANDATMLQLLIDNGADVHHEDGEGNTALLTLCGHPSSTRWADEQVRALQVLMRCGSDLNKCDMDGLTPAIRAQFAGGHRCSSIVAAAGGDTSCTDGIVFAAARRGVLQYGRLKKHLGHLPDLSLCDSNGRSVVFHAAQYGHVDTVLWCIDKGVDINVADKTGFTPLMAAAKNSHAEVVDALLCNGVVIDAQDEQSNTAIMWAALNGHCEVVRVLADVRADLSVQLKQNGNTALLAAAAMGQTPTVKCLLDYGANIKDRDKWGNTPLMLAAGKGHVSTVTLCLSRGADPCAVSYEGGTALTMARGKKGKNAAVNRAAIIKALVDAGAA
jgi:ankyrin repeat protein